MTRAHSTTLRTPPTEDNLHRSGSPGLRFLFPDPRRAPLVLAGARLRLGREHPAEVLLDGPGVSRLHAEIYREGIIWVIRDCNSTNGTFVDGARLAFHPLRPGQVLRIGEHLLLMDSIPRDAEDESFQELAPGLWGGHELRLALAPAITAAGAKLPVIICGETGTGKERVARGIHDRSRRHGPFVAVDCASLPAQLAAGELFGHRRGAFTGAVSAAPGRFRTAHGGTLFLDELTELPLSLQSQLLRVLQEGEVTPLGESLPIRVDVRVIAACQRPLAQYVAEGSFRKDLYMRLAGIECSLPPLRDRVADIPRLFSTFVRSASVAETPAVHVRLMEALCVHDWPGNVRELEMLAERLVVLRPGSALRASDLPIEMQLRPVAVGEVKTRREHDERRLIEALRENGGNLARAAEHLGISRQRAYRVLGGRSVRQLLDE